MDSTVRRGGPSGRFTYRSLASSSELVNTSTSQRWNCSREATLLVSEDRRHRSQRSIDPSGGATPCPDFVAPSHALRPRTSPATGRIARDRSPVRSSGRSKRCAAPSVTGQMPARSRPPRSARSANHGDGDTHGNHSSDERELRPQRHARVVLERRRFFSLPGQPSGVTIARWSRQRGLKSAA